MHPAFTDRLAADILAVEAELRPLIRRTHYEPLGRNEPPLRTRRATSDKSITISADEARTLLRAAMPFHLSAPGRRKEHAALVAALATFTAKLAALNADSPMRYGGPRVTAAALDLVTPLHAWIATARWHEACAAAGVRWPAPVSVTKLPRQRTSPDVPGLFETAPPQAPDGRATWRKRKRLAKADPVQRSILLPIAGTSPVAVNTSNVSTDNQAPADQVPDQAKRRSTA